MGITFMLDSKRVYNQKKIKYGLLIIILHGMLVFTLPVLIFAEEAIGKELFDAYCARCHGFDGDGKGEASNFTFPKPRDFTSGIFKFRSTPSGDPPMDDDLKRIIMRGIPGTSMGSWKGKFNDNELQAIVDVLKGFEEETFEMEGEPFEIGEPPPKTKKFLAMGKELFEKAKCWECHGKFGRGNGEKGWQEGFKDDWGDKIYPTNLTYPWEIKHGAGLKDLYRTVTAGFDGTPMASFADAYSDEQRWGLSYFLKSIQITRKFDSVVRAQKTDVIPTSTEDKVWNNADYIDLQMEGKKLFGLPFIPKITNMRVRTLYTSYEIAFMLEWVDKKPNKGNDGFPPDAVQIHFPITSPLRSKKPSSPSSNLINIWYWSTNNKQVVEFKASGLKKATMVKHQKIDVKAVYSYNNGLYRVIFRRPINTDDKDDVTFSFRKHVPFSVAAYDGQHDEMEERGTLSATRYIFLK